MDDISEAIKTAEKEMGRKLTQEEKGLGRMLSRMIKMSEYANSPENIIGCPFRDECAAYKEPKKYEGNMMAEGIKTRCDVVTKKQLESNYCPLADLIASIYNDMGGMLKDSAEKIHQTIAETFEYIRGLNEHIDENLRKTDDALKKLGMVQ